MSDTLNPIFGEKRFPHKNTEIVFTATAKPRKEIIHPNLEVIQTIDSIAEELQVSDTIDSFKVNEVTKHLEKIENRDVKANLSLLKKEMDALELLEVADALSTMDSPWGTLAQEIAKSDRLKQSLPDTKSREQYIDKLLFPLGAQIFCDIRSMTADPLTRQLMFHSIADDLQKHPERIHAAQALIPLSKDSDQIKHTMRRASITLLGTKLTGHESYAQIDTLYKKIIHTTVLQSRLSAEQPLFDMATMEHTLNAAKLDASQTSLSFAKEESAQTLRETQTEFNDMKRIRHIIDQELPHVHNESSLMQALDKVQDARFQGTIELAPYKIEPWVPENVRTNARKALELLSQPKEDIYAKTLKKLDALEHRFRSQQVTWSETKYKDHMKWLADPVAQANRNQRIINIVDLIMTLTTLVYGTTGGIQRQIEGSHPSGMSITDIIDYVESQHPWEVAADFATPKKAIKSPKI